VDNAQNCESYERMLGEYITRYMLLLLVLQLSLPGQAMKFLMLQQQSRWNYCLRLITFKFAFLSNFFDTI
jgi:hypothetical protein